MNKDFMPDLPLDQRLQALKDHCDEMEETSYYRDLTNDELDVVREQFSDNAIKISEFDEVFDDAKTEHKANTKPLKLANKEFIEQIKTRKAKVDGVLFHMANHADGVMETYNELGEFISSRRLRPDEKQPRLFSVAKPAASDQ